MLKAKIAWLLQEKVSAVTTQQLENNQNPMFELYKIADLTNVLLKMEQDGVENRKHIDEYISSPKLTLVERDKAHLFFSDQVSLLDIIEATAEKKAQAKEEAKGTWTLTIHFSEGSTTVQSGLSKTELEEKIKMSVLLNDKCISFSAFKTIT